MLELVRPSSLRGSLLLVACAALLLLLPAAARAAAPANDAFSGAVSLAPGATVFGNNLNATAEGAEPSPTSDAVSPTCSHVTDGPSCASSVWYAFHAPTTGNYTIDTCDYGTDLGGIVSVWTGSGLGSLSLLTFDEFVSSGFCAAAGGNNGSSVSFDANAGTTYWVDVEGYAATQGVFYLRAYRTSAGPPSAEPDTLINREHSLAYARLEFNLGPSEGNEIQSGPRQTASFDFASDQAGATFECSLDGAAFAACASPVSYDGLDSGDHTFKVRSIVGGVPDPTPAAQIFTLDDTSPDTGISGPTGSLMATTAAWDLTTSDSPFEQTYKCEFDSSVPFPCNDSHPSFSNLCAGLHSLHAFAFDQANNVDATPAVASIDTDGGPGDDCGAPTLVGSPSVSADPTDAGVSTSFDTTGSGGTLRLDWGPTTAYGNSVSTPVLPEDTSADPALLLLTPATEYHYRFTLTTPSGTVVGGDHTFTTDAASDLPDVSLGTPVAAGAHAVAIPINIDPHGSSVSSYGVFIDEAPVTLSSPFVNSTGTLSETAPFQRTLDVVDLAPETTYHVRAYAFGDFNGAESSERTFTTPAVTIPAPPQPPPVSSPGPPPPPPLVRFRLKAAQVHVGPLRRSSKTVTLTVGGLPAGAVVSVQLRAGAGASALKTLARAHARANAHGIAKLRLKLSAKARRLLHNRRVKSVTIRVAATSGHGAPSVVTLHKRLR